MKGGKPSFTVVIDGLIGCGKSSLLKKLQKSFGYATQEQRVWQWTLLESYYKEPRKYAVPLQEQILDSYKDIWEENNSRGGVVLTEAFSTSSFEVFVRMLHDDGIISSVDFGELEERTLKYRPELFIYLDTKAEVCMKRIEGRQRKGEENIKLDYLQRLSLYYEDFITKYSSSSKSKTATNLNNIIMPNSMDTSNSGSDMKKMQILVEESGQQQQQMLKTPQCDVIDQLGSNEESRFLLNHQHQQQQPQHDRMTVVTHTQQNYCRQFPVVRICNDKMDDIDAVAQKIHDLILAFGSKHQHHIPNDGDQKKNKSKNRDILMDTSIVMVPAASVGSMRKKGEENEGSSHYFLKDNLFMVKEELI